MSEAELDKLLLGLLSYLASSTHVVGIRSKAGTALGDPSIQLWEQKTCRKLPEDLKQFYRTFDGLSVEWDVSVHGTSTLLGKIFIPALSQLKKLPASELKPVCAASDSDRPSDGTLVESTTTEHRPVTPCNVPKPDSSLVLDSCEYGGTTCIVFGNTDSQQGSSASYSIHLKPPSGDWTPLAPSLAHYLRLAAVHLGMMGWPLKLISGYIAPHLRVWYSLCLPSTNTTSPAPGESRWNAGSSPHSQHEEHGSRQLTNVLNTAKLTALFNGSQTRVSTSQGDKQQQESSVRKARPSKA